MYDFITVENQRRSGGGSGGKNDESESKSHPALLALDVILVICICVEVLIRYLATSENFFNRCSNFSDVALSFLCVIGLFCMNSLTSFLRILLPSKEILSQNTFIKFQFKRIKNFY